MYRLATTVSAIGAVDNLGHYCATRVRLLTTTITFGPRGNGAMEW
jgi:hypothetical protein